MKPHAPRIDPPTKPSSQPLINENPQALKCRYGWVKSLILMSIGGALVLAGQVAGDISHLTLDKDGHAMWLQRIYGPTEFKDGTIALNDGTDRICRLIERNKEP